MSSHAYVRFESGGVTRDEWSAWCAQVGLTHRPELAGGNVWTTGGNVAGVEAEYGQGDRREHELQESASEILLYTQWGGPRVQELAELARAFWVSFGGAMYADEAVRRLICQA